MPLQKSIENSKSYELNTVVTTKKYTAKEVFAYPEPAERIKLNKPKSIWIRFEISNKESELIKSYFESENLSEIGREIFDYFLAREVNAG